jgi:hypothetical protein
VPTAIASLTELLIATRHAPDEIQLAAPMSGWSWCCGAVEYAKTGTGSLNAWMVVERDGSQMGLTSNARVAIKSVRMMVLVDGVWHIGMSGTPGLSWTVTSNIETNGEYVDVGHNVEPDGSWSFAFPPNRALHFSQVSPGYVIGGTATGVAVVVEARVIGGSPLWGLAAGADYKDVRGFCSAICGAAGEGAFGLLTGSYRWYTMLVTTLTDAQVRALPPF